MALALMLAAGLLASILPAPPSPVTAASVPPGGAPPPGSGTKTSGPFVRVIDGMTIDTYIDGQQVGIHLVGISAPQGNTACGRLATKELQTLVISGQLTLEEDTQIAFTTLGSAKGSRLRVYFARTKGGQPVTQALVKAGVAAVDGSEGEPGHHFDSDQAVAQAGHVGCLWGGTGPGPTGASAPGVGPAVVDQQAAGSHAFRAGLAAPDWATAAAVPLAAVAAPSNFVVQSAVTGLNTPTSFTWLPDGRMLVIEKAGRVRVVKNGALLAAPLIDLTSRVNDYWDHGVLGIAIDSSFAANGLVYLFYTYEDNAAAYNGPKTVRVARYTVVGDTAAAASEQVVLGTQVGAGCGAFPAGADCIGADSPSHNGGGLEFAGDGTLWVSVGDGASFNVVDDLALRAQDVTSLNGKLLHVTTAGQGVSGNPFWNGTAGANRSKVWASGFRNPFRFTLRPGTSTPYIGDVGWNTWEEENVGVAGGNYGWPCYEGQAQQDGYAPKATCQTLYNQGTAAVRSGLVTYNHLDTNGTAVGTAAVGGAFYTGTSYPAQYRGAYFYADYGRSDLRYVTVDANNAATGSPQIFATAADGPVDLEMGADGNLYYAAINVGEIRRIAYGTQTATATATPQSGPAPLAVQFSSAGTTDLYGGALAYSWNFGDGSAASTAANPAHTYAGDGIYNAVLTATNSHGEAAAARATVTVGAGGCPVGQYLAQYFGTKDLSGNVLAARCEAAPIGDTLGTTAAWPPAGVPTTNFSARWDGQFAFATAGSYTFTATADDGIRVYLDSALVIDHWVDEAPTTYTYTAPSLAAGNHAVKVEFYQGTGGATAQVSWAVTAAQPPTATISSPTSALTYKVGDTISYAGSATDPKDGTIPASGLSWQVIIHHCPSPTSCHTHYLLQNQPGASGSFAAPDHGGFDDSYLELQLTATDSSGLTSTASVSIHPIKVQVTLATSPIGLQVVAGGTAYTAPVTLQGVPGSRATIQVASPQGGQAFASWSDGGAQQHDITVPSTNTTYTASFTSTTTSCPAGQYLALYFANTTLSGAPAATRCEAAPLNDTLGTTAAWPPAGVPTTNFSVRWDGQFSFATAGSYTFTATADDGVRLFLDGGTTPLINGWKDQSATTYTATTTLTAATHEVKVEYYQAAGGATAQVNWQAATGPSPDFSISAAPSSQSVAQGANTTYTVTVTAANGFAGSVALAVSGLPAEATSSFTPATVGGAGTSALKVTAGTSTPVGSYPLMITGTSGALSHTASATLVVTAPATTPDFSVSATPSKQSIARGGSTTYTVTITPTDGFTGNVTLSVSGLPNRTSGAFSPNPATTSSTLTVTTSNQGPKGTFTLTITGTSGNVSHSTTVTLVLT